MARSAALAPRAPHIAKRLGVLSLSHRPWQHKRGTQPAPTNVQGAFTTPQKREQAVAYTHAELLAYLRKQLFSSAADLGDPAKETAEEMGERWARTLAQCTTALQRLLALACPADAGAPGAPAPSQSASEASLPDAGQVSPAPLTPPLGNAAQRAPDCSASHSAASADATPHARDAKAASLGQLQQALEAFWRDQKFWQLLLSPGKSDAGMRASGYLLVTTLAQRHVSALQDNCSMLAPLVLGAVADTEHIVQQALWRMLLRFVAAAPGALSDPQAADIAAKQLLGLLESGQVSETGAAAMLPFVAQLRQHGADLMQAAPFAEQALSAAAAGLLIARNYLRNAQCGMLAQLLLHFLRRSCVEDGAPSPGLAPAALQPFLVTPQGLPAGCSQALADALVTALMAGVICTCLHA